MKAVHGMKYENAQDLRTKGLLLTNKWLTAVAKIREIGNTGCTVKDHQFDTITYSSEDLSFVMVYDVNSDQQDVFTIQLGNARYTVILNRTQPDHLQDSLIVSGQPSLITVGEDAWCRVVSRCFEKILFYTPSE